MWAEGEVMPCYKPLTGYRSTTKNPKTGKYPIKIIRKEEVVQGEGIQLACGQCYGCRLERSRQWAIRCVHEADSHEENSFVTLTYDNENLPQHGTLNIEDWQKFMKRLRKKLGKVVRYFHCGEYGDELGRPHYHACLFGHDFEDKKYHKDSKTGHPLYTSELLTTTWGKGHCLIGELTFDSAAYVARYVMKKITGEQATEHYKRCDEATGEIYNLQPEYTTMSRRPGIGKEWYDRYKTDVYPDDEIIILRDGKAMRMKPPKYYNGLYEIQDPDGFAKMKTKRKEAIKPEENTPERLRAKLKCKLKQTETLKRGLHHD